MASLNVSPNELLNLVHQLRLCSNTLNEDINTANRLLSAISTVWVGNELQNLTARAHHSTSECLQLSDTLARLADSIECASMAYQQTEQSFIDHFQN